MFSAEYWPRNGQHIQEFGADPEFRAIITREKSHDTFELIASPTTRKPVPPTA